MAYSMEQKQQVLVENAKAYYNRGNRLQYDQLSMDRLVRITPRNTRYAPPEMATEQHMLFLDCSTFIYTLYYNVFGYQLESNLTWNIPHMMKPCVYELKLTHQETREEKIKIRDEIMSILQPGDVLNKVRVSGSGHVVLYIGDGKIMHSTIKSPNSYRYDDLHDGIYEHGTIYCDPLSMALDVDAEKRTIFEATAASVQILRPLERMGDPTPAALSRAGKSKDLHFSVLSSHPGGKTAWEGDTVTYTLKVSNLGEETRSVQGFVKETCQLKLLENENGYSFDVAPGETVERAFRFCVGAVKEPVCQPPYFEANDIPLWAERVLIGRRMEEAVLAKVSADVTEASGNSLYTRIVSAYGNAGITLPDSDFRLLFPLYRLIDSTAGEILWRFPQMPERDLSLYSFFGGIGVITPDICADSNLRVQKFWPADLKTGDVVMVSEDREFQTIHCIFVTEKGLLYQFQGQEISFLEHGEEADKLIDSLPGRFCYTVFRPEQQSKEALEKCFLQY